MSRFRYVLQLLLVVSLAGGLVVAPVTYAQDAGSAADPATLPLLPEQRHIGSMFYGWGAPPPAQIQPRIDDATAVGMNAYTVYLDWPVLEPEQSQYDLQELRETLEWASANGLSTFANITVIDIESLVMPAEFLAGDESEDVAFAKGTDFTNPVLMARFFLLLDEVVPLMVEHGVFYLAVGNEVDGWLDNNPDQLGDYLQFVQATREYVHAMVPELAVGVTVTGLIPMFEPERLDDFYQVADVVSSNFYAIDVNDFTITDEAGTVELLERFVAAFDGRPIVIPELGCSSAESMNSSPRQQQQCFETMFGVLEEHPNVRFATVFTFHDFEPEICSAIQAVFGYEPGVEHDNIFDERIADYLCTLGFVNADGSPKPAFDAFLAGVQALQAATAETLQ